MQTSGSPEAISFFLAALLVSAFAVRWLWNRLAKDFAWLPRLSVGTSLAVVAVWGLLFLVVLTMIAATSRGDDPRLVAQDGDALRSPRARCAAPGRHAADGGANAGRLDGRHRLDCVPWHTLPRVTVNPPAVVSGVVVFTLFIAVVEGFARWWCRGAYRASGERRQWHFRWTALIVVGVFPMFAIGYCAIGLARQTAWGV